MKRLHADLPWSEVRQKLIRIFSSGGPLSTDAAKELYEWYGQSATEVYGSSETGGIAWRIQYSDDAKWHPLPGITIKIDEHSRLHIKSPHIDANHWHATDDAVQLHENDTFTLLGRIDRIIKLEEKRLSLVEMEQALLQTGLVQEAYCMLLPKQGYRDILGAVIVPTATGNNLLNNEGKSALGKTLKQSLLHHFELSLLPRKWRFVSHIPVNEQDKINHKAMHALFANDN